jgi:hypothetical protein
MGALIMAIGQTLTLMFINSFFDAEFDKILIWPDNATSRVTCRPNDVGPVLHSAAEHAGVPMHGVSTRLLPHPMRLASRCLCASAACGPAATARESGDSRIRKQRILPAGATTDACNLRLNTQWQYGLKGERRDLWHGFHPSFEGNRELIAGVGSATARSYHLDPCQCVLPFHDSEPLAVSVQE